MLGRLRMTVEECIQIYEDMCVAIFKRKATSMPISFLGRLKARYSSELLDNAIQHVLAQRGYSKKELLKEESETARPVT